MSEINFSFERRSNRGVGCVWGDFFTTDSVRVKEFGEFKASEFVKRQQLTVTDSQYCRYDSFSSRDECEQVSVTVVLGSGKLLKETFQQLFHKSLILKLLT